MPTATKERPILFSGPMVRAILDGRKSQTRRIVKPHKANADGICMVGYEDAPEQFAKATWPYCLFGDGITDENGCDHPIPCPYGSAGDRLWVRESFSIIDDPASVDPSDPNDDGDVERWGVCRKRGRDGERWVVDYKADNPQRMMDITGQRKWTPSIHMPRWASRITLEITGVRVELVQDISEIDAMAEGTGRYAYDPIVGHQWYPEIGQPKCQSGIAANAKECFQIAWEAINGHESWESNPWVWCVEFRRVEP